MFILRENAPVVCAAKINGAQLSLKACSNKTPFPFTMLGVGGREGGGDCVSELVCAQAGVLHVCMYV